MNNGYQNEYDFVKLFNNKDINKVNSQLIFTTHATNLLNLEILRRDQIWFVEKNPLNGNSELYPLDSFSVRKDMIVGKVIIIIPALGSIMLFIQNNIFIVLGIIALIVLLSEIFKSSRKKAEVVSKC